MGAVEGIDKTATVFDRGPSSRLDCAGYFKGQFVKILLPFVKRGLSFHHQPQQITVGAGIVEAVVMDAGMAYMGRHQFQGFCPSLLQKFFLSGGIKLQNGRTKLKTLGPFGPSTGSIFSAGGKDR